MIVRKGRLALYDVDLIGGAIVAVLACATWWLAVMPWMDTWQRYRAAAAACAAAQKRLEKDLLEWKRFEGELTHLQQVVAQQVAEAPQADTQARLLRELTDVAKDADVELLNVAPQPETTSGTYLVHDIQFTARGRSHDFIRFLDRLAQRNPYQSLCACSIVRAANATEPTCELSWTARLFMLKQNSDKHAGAVP